MNTTDCQAGYATDDSFQIPSPSILCTSPIAVHWALTVFEVVVRFFTSLQVWREWSNRIKANKIKGRIPIFPATSFSASFLYLISNLLLGFNYANVHNGVSFVLLSICYLPFCLSSSLLLHRTVRLGSRIIPLASAQKYQSRLSNLTNFGKGLVFFQAISLITSIFVLIVLTPIFPENFLVLGIIGFSFKALFQFFVFFSLVVQYQRCISVIDEIQAANNRSDKTVKFARRLMRQKQVFIVPFMILNPVEFLLLCVQAIPWNIYFVFHWHVLAETIGSAFLEAFTVRSKKSMRNKTVNSNKVEDETTSGFASNKYNTDGKGTSENSKKIQDLSVNGNISTHRSLEMPIVSHSE